MLRIASAASVASAGVLAAGVDVEGAAPFSNKGVQDESPSWSADSRAIAYVSKGDVFVMNADGSAKRNLTNSKQRESEALWSP